MDIRTHHQPPLSQLNTQRCQGVVAEEPQLETQPDKFEKSRAEPNFWSRHVGLSSVHNSGGRTFTRYRHSDGLRASVAAADMGLMATGSILAQMPELAQIWGGAPALVSGGVAAVAGIHLVASLCQMSTDGPIPFVTKPLLKRART